MCLSPIRAAKQEFGRPKFCHEGELCLPCGKCTECIKKRAIEWAQRAKHEISLHNENCFLTLTYDEDNLPSQFIIKDDFQLFMKRLRKKLKKKIRYMVSYEYGSQKFRPHFHAIIFGYSPRNQKLLKKTPKGDSLFTSEEIKNLWNKGFHSIGTANEKTAFYIASYALKGKKHELIHPTTGEIQTVQDSMDVSKKPAIGLEYLNQNAEQLVNSNEPLPRYYVKKLPEKLLEEYENKLIFNLKTRSSQELLAKFVIDQQKLDQSPSHYREIDLDKKSLKGFKSILTNIRNTYVTATKAKK